MLRRVLIATAASALFATGASAVFIPGASAVFIPGASAATVNYSARLSGAREIPKIDTKGKGEFTGTYDTTSKTLNYTLTFDNLSGPATAAHLHGPATRRQNAGVLVPLGDKNPTSPITGSVTLNDEQAKALQSNRTYVNVHTAANPNGEIRGQVTHRTGKHAASKKTTS